MSTTTERMQQLINYGVKQPAASTNSGLQYHVTAANGKIYGIVKEQSKYYLKESAPSDIPGNYNFEYLTGISGKRDFCYSSYNQAFRQLEQKLHSINESVASSVKLRESATKPADYNSISEETIAATRESINRVHDLNRRVGAIGYKRFDGTVVKESYTIPPVAEVPGVGKDGAATKGDVGQPFYTNKGALNSAEADEKKDHSVEGDNKDVKVEDSVATQNPKPEMKPRVNEEVDLDNLEGVPAPEGLSADDDFKVEDLEDVEAPEENAIDMLSDIVSKLEDFMSKATETEEGLLILNAAPEAEAAPAEGDVPPVEPDVTEAKKAEECNESKKKINEGIRDAFVSFIMEELKDKTVVEKKK